MMHLILVKHSIPDIVETLPAKTWKLSKSGRERCSLLAEKLRPYAPGFIFTSTEPKATETGQIVAEILNLPCQTMPDLQEHDRTGEPYRSRTEFEQLVRRFFVAPDTLVFGNETANVARDRFAGAIQACIEPQPEQDVVAVAHGTVITLFVAQHNEIDVFDLWNRLTMPSYVVLSLPDFRLVEVVETVG